MPNRKSNKIAAPFPPLLNLAQDRPHIDDNYQNYEKQNGPYINNMIMPVYTENLGQKEIFDYKGNEYAVIDNYLVKNKTEKLFPVVSEHFEKDEADFHKYLAFDIDDTYTLDSSDPTAYAILDDDTNSISFNYGGLSYMIDDVFTEATIVTARCRIIGDSAVLVVYFDEANVGKILYARLGSDIKYSTIFRSSWKRQRCRYQTGTNYMSSPLLTTVTITDANPIIQITSVPDNGIGVSLVSDFGHCLNSQTNGFITFVEIDRQLYHYGSGLIPASSSQTAEVTSEYSTYFRMYDRNSVTSNIGGAFLKKDGVYYDYVDTGVVGPVLDFPTTYQPEPSEVDYITIDGVTYDYGTYTYTYVQSELRCINTMGDSTWSFKGTWNGNEYSSSAQSSGTTSAVISADMKVYRGQTYDISWHDASITWAGTDYDFSDRWINTGNKLFTRTETTTQSVSWLVAPNIFLDNGKMYSLWGFNPNLVGSWSNSGTDLTGQYYSLSQGSSIVESAYISGFSAGSTKTYYFTPLSFHVVRTTNMVRSNAFCIGQNFYQSWVRLNNSVMPTPDQVNTGTSINADGGLVAEYMNTNETDLIYNPGSANVGTNSTYYYNYYGNNKGVEGNMYDSVSVVPGGFRCQIGDTGWRMLYSVSVTGSYQIDSISYTPALHQMGTLVAPWSDVDPNSYIIANDKIVIYKSAKVNKFYRVHIEEDYLLSTIVEDRYILINTTSFWNMYDAKIQKPFHYATDYDNRCFLGSKTYSELNYKTNHIRYFISGINRAYDTLPRYTVTSMLRARFALNGVLSPNQSTVNIYDSVCPETQDVQAIDVYYSDENVSGTIVVSYRYSLSPFVNFAKFDKYYLNGSSYTLDQNAYISPNIFTKYINGQGNHDGVVENDSNYVLKYQTNVVQPQLIYEANTETIDQKAFFVLQGQFYGVLDDKIYSLVYSNGIITERDAIVDIRGMQFIGNNPMIAFFWSPSLRSIYSFTGDANLEHLYYASKFTEVLNNDSTYWYDESTQTIWVPTNRGLLALGPKNTFFFEDWNKVTNVQISEDGITHITNDGITYNVSYYPKEGYTAKMLDIESSFWGKGSTDISSIDRFGITLYNVDETHPTTEVLVGVRSITDITVKSEERKIKITPDMWDKWSHSVLINYNPQLIQGQGIRLYVQTDQALQQVTIHTQDRNTTQLAHANI